MNIWIGNVPPGASDEDIKQFLMKYGFPEISEIRHEPGDGSRPAVVVSFEGLKSSALRPLAQRVHGMYWKERTLVVQAM
jgi:hypothetical protein